MYSCIHTYIIGHYNPSVRITDLVSHTHLCMLILNISGGTYSLKSIPNDRFFRELFKAILFTRRVLGRNLLTGNRRRNTFCILLWCLAWGSKPGFKPTHYLLDYGYSVYKLNKIRSYLERSKPTPSGLNSKGIKDSKIPFGFLSLRSNVTWMACIFWHITCIVFYSTLFFLLTWEANANPIGTGNTDDEANCFERQKVLHTIRPK